MTDPGSRSFDPDCRQCPRLAAFLDEVKREQPDYHCRPVAPFGAANAALLIVGLAPGMHGANRTGRPFTGDYAGDLLYRTMHAHGFASRPVSVSADDGLELLNCRISNAVKCLPPDNKPIAAEVNACNAYLARELDQLGSGSVVLALGGIAHKAVIRARRLRQADYKFAHNAVHALDGLTLVDSYHCSRYNTNTGRLTEAMFSNVFATASRCMESHA